MLLFPTVKLPPNAFLISNQTEIWFLQAVERHASLSWLQVYVYVLLKIYVLVWMSNFNLYIAIACFNKLQNH